MKGLVIKNTGSWYLVRTQAGETVPCKIKGTFRLKGLRCTNPVAVGDCAPPFPFCRKIPLFPLREYRRLPRRL